MKIRYYGHAGQKTGYGRAAEGMINALLTAGADVEIRSLAPYDTLDLEHDLPLAKRLLSDNRLSPSPDVVIVHTLPMDCPRVVQIASATLRAPALGAPRPLWIAYTTWEALRVPESVVRPLEVFDEVWHPSIASGAAFVGRVNPSDSVDCIRVVPHCFDADKLADYRRPRDPKKTVDCYRFYSIGAWNPRKNPIGLIRAFAHAFDKTDNVELLLSCQGMTPDQLTHAICSTGIHPQDLPPIRSDFTPLTNDQIWDLHRHADCFVSASRGEAWNLPAFEAVLVGRPVITTLGLGSDDFLEGTSARRVHSYPMPAMVETRATRDGRGTQIQTVGAQGLSSKSLWREPDLYQLACDMREAYREGRRTLEVNYDLGAKFGYKAVGELAMAALRHLQTTVHKEMR